MLKCVSMVTLLLLSNTDQKGYGFVPSNSKSVEMKLVKILQEQAESKHKAYLKHQKERWTNISYQTIKLQVISRVSRSS